ncbi:hypothetical protein C0J52_13297 [Blattella germanica]|nr:hypothetical protein C0J52_13297 [Blattella germanica]
MKNRQQFSLVSCIPKLFTSLRKAPTMFSTSSSANSSGISPDANMSFTSTRKRSSATIPMLFKPAFEYNPDKA